MTTNEKNCAIYLDHIFVLTEAEASAVEQIVQMGLVEGIANTHPGQGTSNRRFFLENLTIELLYINDAAEAENGPGKNLRLVNRVREQDSCPFGLVSRVTDSRAVPEFKSWQYYPDYFNGSMCFYVGENSNCLAEPLCICMPPELPLKKDIPKKYANHDWNVTSIYLSVPVDVPTEELAYFAEMDNLYIEYGKPHKLTVVLNNGVAGNVLNLELNIPVILKW